MDIFETTKNAVKELLRSEAVKNMLTYIVKIGDTEHKFGLEQNDIDEISKNIQAINLGVLDEVTVTDKAGTKIVMSKDAYVKRNLAGFGNKVKEELDLNYLLDIVDRIEKFADFVHFGSLQMAKGRFLLKKDPDEIPEEECEIEE